MKYGNALLPILLVALLAFSGCAGKSPDAAEKAHDSGLGSASGNGSRLEFPDNGRAYVATYVMDQNGERAMKKIYVMGSSRRVDFLEENGGVIFSAYFLEGKAYSCSSLAGTESCFDITGSLTPELAGTFSDERAPKDGQDAGTVDIGGTQGSCYLIPYGQFSKRKMCYTDRGVLAYDEYNESKGKEYVAYATKITYYAKESDFALPFEPKEKPG